MTNERTVTVPVSNFLGVYNDFPNYLYLPRGGAALANLGYTPVNKAGDTLTGVLLTPMYPSFFVAKTDGDVNAVTDILFNNVSYNVGGCYNPSTGRFTASVSGLYQFSVNHISSNTTVYTEVVLTKNGSGYGTSRGAGGNTTQAGGAGTFLVPLLAGDYVAINNRSNSGCYGFGFYTTFCGTLVG